MAMLLVFSAKQKNLCWKQDLGKQVSLGAYKQWNNSG